MQNSAAKLKLDLALKCENPILSTSDYSRSELPSRVVTDCEGPEVERRNLVPQKHAIPDDSASETASESDYAPENGSMAAGPAFSTSNSQDGHIHPDRRGIIATDVSRPSKKRKVSDNQEGSTLVNESSSKNSSTTLPCNAASALQGLQRNLDKMFSEEDDDLDGDVVEESRSLERRILRYVDDTLNTNKLLKETPVYQYADWQKDLCIFDQASLAGYDTHA